MTHWGPFLCCPLSHVSFLVLGSADARAGAATAWPLLPALLLPGKVTVTLDIMLCSPLL